MSSAEREFLAWQASRQPVPAGTSGPTLIKRRFATPVEAEYIPPPDPADGSLIIDRAITYFVANSLDGDAVGGRLTIDVTDLLDEFRDALRFAVGLDPLAD